MGYILGLDLGSNSIGWALVDEGKKKILRSGVRVFPEGVDRDKQGGEVSKNENRRIKRGMRRQIFRRARRKAQLRAVLIKAKLLPAKSEEQLALDGMNPYELRVKGLSKKLEPFELGRVLIHLNQRRGFKSNRKGAKSKEEKGMLADMSSLAKEIDESGSQTLGEFLYKKYKAGGINVRLRKRHTRREMLQVEFEKIWEKQSKFYPKVLTPKLREGLWDKLIAYQRAMYWPKSVVGKCELEPKERRCRRAHRVAQLFRMYHEVNNLKVFDTSSQLRPLATQEREKLIAYLSGAKERTFDEIRKHLGMLESQGFNMEFGDRRKLLGLATDVTLAGKKLFGKAWHEMPDEKKNQIVNVLLDEGIDEETQKRVAIDQWEVNEELAGNLVELDFPEGYASYSLPAMLKLLPHLKRGLPLSGGTGEEDALHAAGYVRADERVLHQQEFLPEPPELTNPLVRAALFQVRQVVNAVIREHGKPEAVHIELARDVKGTAQQRALQSWKMREREALRTKAAEEVEKIIGKRARRSDIEQYILWQEQDKVCMYSGKTISRAKLFGGDVDVDHILPYSRSLDDSQLNKVLVFRNENAEKGNRTPHEWLAHSDLNKYEKILQRAAKLPLEVRNAKRPRFAAQSVELNDFVERQLNDTKYIARKVAEYVRCLGVDVVCTKGQCTSELRHYWGLDTVLRDDGLNLKNRQDHRHHAVDAVIIAMTSRKRLQALARCRGREELPLPWDKFRDAVEASINAINVSHRVERRVSGALHEETLYGPTAKPWNGGAEERRDVDGKVKERPWATGWIEEKGAFVYRKTLETLTAAMVEDIRDPILRNIVEKRLKKHGVEPGSSKGIPAAVWKEPLCMPGKNGPTIRKLRLIKRDETIRPIRGGRACVKPGSNHHVCIFEYEENGKKKREPVWVSMLEAARRIRDKEILINRKHPTKENAKFIMSLSRGEMILGTFKNQERLCVFQTGASTQGQLYFAVHTDARKSGEKEKFAVKSNTLVGRKVTIDPLGRIRWAND